jgi:hypothetical protein
VDGAGWSLRGCPGLLLRGSGGDPALVPTQDGAGRGGPGPTEAASGPGDHGQGGAALPAPGDRRAGAGGGHDLGTWDRSTFSRSDAQRAGKRATHMCAYPDLSFPQCIPQSLRQVRPEEERKRKGQGRSWRTIATLGQR